MAAAAIGYYQHIVVESGLQLVRSIADNGSFLPAVSITATPSGNATGYSVTETLPPGVEPVEITHDAVWTATNRVLRRGPFLDATLRVFTYEPQSAYVTWPAVGRMSVHGVGDYVSGDAIPTIGLPPPENVAAVAGNRALYLLWERNGHEAGFNLDYWTQPDRSDERAVDIGLPAADFYALTGVTNDVTYYLAMTAYDAQRVESARSATVSARPPASAGYYGQVWLDATNYPAVTNVAVVTLEDADLNQSGDAVESAMVWIRSDTDTNGFWLLLRETGPDTGIFTSEAKGTNLSFTFSPSVPVMAQLQVKEGDAVLAICDDALPVGLRIATAQFMEYDGNGSGVPDWWERVHFGGSGVITPTSDADGDGARDIDEFLAGTDPRDPSSVFKVVEVRPGVSGEVVLQWAGVAGRLYAIDKTHNLAAGFYELVTGLLATPPVNTYRDPSPVGAGQVFYRILLLPAE